MVLSLALTGLQRHANQDEVSKALYVESQGVIERSVAALDRVVQGLRGARGYLLGVGLDRTTSDGFKAYVATRNLDREFPGVMGQGLIRRVPKVQEAAYVASMRQRVSPDFTIRQLTPHDGELRIIELVEPLEPNRAARGLDTASEANRMHASELALQSDEPEITGPIRLVQSKPGSSMGLLLFLRILPLPTSQNLAQAQGLASVSAFVYAPIQLDTLLASVAPHSDLMSMALVDVTQPGDPRDFVLPHGSEKLEAHAPTVTVERTVMMRQWRFTFQAKPALAASLRLTPPWVWSVGGAFTSVLLAMMTGLWLALQRRRDEALSERVRLRSLLDNASDAVVALDLAGRVTLWNHAATRLFGYAMEQALGQALSDLTLDAAHLEEDAALIRTSMAGQTTPPFETQRRHRDGWPIDVELSAGPILNARGQVVGVAKVMRSIRERLESRRKIQAHGEELEKLVATRTRALEASRQDLRNVLDAMPSMVASWDKQLHNRFANEAYAAYFGRHPEDILPLTLPELLGPELFAHNEPYVQCALQGQAQQFERDLPLANGQGVRHTLVHYLPYWQGGEVVGFYVMVHDVTAIKQAQQRLATNEELLARTEAMARVGGWEMDVQTQTLRWSEGTCRIHAVPVGHQPTVDEAIHYYIEPDREVITQAVRNSISSGAGWDLELQLDRADGRRIWVRALGEAEGQNGQVVRLRGSIQDITEQVNARERIDLGRQLLQVVIDTVDEAFALFDANDRLVSFNEKYRALHPLVADVIVPGVSFESIIREGVRRGLYKAALEQGDAWVQERLAQHRLLSSNSFEELTDGHVLRVTECRLADGRSVTIWLDVTELVSARKAAEAASQAKTDFLASTSHEIRTPLNAIVGLSYLLERESLPAEPRMQVRRIAQAARSLLGIVNEVLDLSKIVAGQLDLDNQAFELLPMLQAELGVHSGAVRDKGLRVVFHADPTLPTVVKGDPVRLRQVLANLLSNALKFTEQGEVSLNVRHGARSPLIEFEVCDTGIGIASEVQTRLFRPFEQADASTSRQYGGTGLGLAITAQLVEAMGGEIKLDSALGQGSRFTVTIPLPVTEAGELGHRSTEWAPISVLLAEDEASQRRALVAMMTALGWRCEAVAGGEAMLQAAIDAVRNGQGFDVLVVDWQMPDLNGLAALAELHMRLPESEWPCALVVTQHDLAVVQQDPRMSLASALLTKPVDSSSLFNAVSESLASRPDRMQQLVESSLRNSDEFVWLPGVRVLVVDDSSLNLDVARKVLEREGATVVTCDSGLLALNTLRRLHESFDAVLMDVQMPGMDGVEVARQIREMDGVGPLPIIALTAGVLREERDRALASGMNEFLSKPLDPRRMIATLRSLVQRERGKVIPVQLRSKNGANGLPSAKESLGIAGINEDYIDDRPLLLSMIRRLLAEFGSVSHEPTEGLQARMHKLRGSAQIVGAGEVAKSAHDVEVALKRADGSAVQLHLGQLQSLLDALMQAARPALDVEDQRLAAAQRAVEVRAANAEPMSPAALSKLRDLVASQSTRARQFATEHADGLAAALGVARMTRLMAALGEFDFQSAASALAGDRQGQP